MYMGSVMPGPTDKAFPQSSSLLPATILCLFLHASLPSLPPSIDPTPLASPMPAPSSKGKAASGVAGQNLARAVKRPKERPARADGLPTLGARRHRAPSGSSPRYHHYGDLLPPSLPMFFSLSRALFGTHSDSLFLSPPCVSISPSRPALAPNSELNLNFELKVSFSSLAHRRLIHAAHY